MSLFPDITSIIPSPLPPPGPCSSLFLLGKLQLLPDPCGQQQEIEISEFYRDYSTQSLPVFPLWPFLSTELNKNHPGYVLKFDWGKRDQEDRTLRKKIQLEPFCLTIIREIKSFPYRVNCKFHSSLMDNWVVFPNDFSFFQTFPTSCFPLL